LSQPYQRRAPKTIGGVLCVQLFSSFSFENRVGDSLIALTTRYNVICTAVTQCTRTTMARIAARWKNVAPGAPRYLERRNEGRVPNLGLRDFICRNKILCTWIGRGSFQSQFTSLNKTCSLHIYHHTWQWSPFFYVYTTRFRKTRQP
jgi:hypothetical protein